MKKNTKFPAPKHADILAWRTKSGLSQQAAADLLMTSLRTYTAYERGETRMHPILLLWAKEKAPATK